MPDEDRGAGGPGASLPWRLGPDDSPGFVLWRVSLRWQRLMLAALRPLGLTHVQFVLLAGTWWLIDAAGQTPSQRQLADHAGTDPMMTSQVLRTLEQKGLIARRRHQSDSRVRTLAVTETGQALARRAVAAVEGADADFFAAGGDVTSLLAALRPLLGPQAEM